jgi:hypothetical protein
MNTQTVVKDMNTIRKLGIEALNEKLGPIGMVEFMRQAERCRAKPLLGLQNP